MNKLVNIFYISSFILSISIGVVYFYLIKLEPVGFFIYSILAPILLCLPILVQKIKVIQKNYNYKLIQILKLFVSMIIYVHSIGSLWLYKQPFQYDQLAHFITLVLVTIMLAFLYKIITVDILKRKESSLFFMFSILFILGFFGGVLNELIQFSSDLLFGSKMFFDPTQLTYHEDSLTDIRANTLGIITALIFLKIKWNYIKTSIAKKSTL